MSVHACNAQLHIVNSVIIYITILTVEHTTILV
jgi:hypothetical protein